MKRFVATVLAVILLAGEAAAMVEICGDGVDNDESGTAGECAEGEVDAVYGGGCDRLCSGPDKDGDAYPVSGWTGPYGSAIDCDDTDRTIFPGVATAKGCSGGQWRTCQADGTYTSCSSSDWCPSGCGTCYYVDPSTGSNSNNGLTVATAWANQLMFASYYTEGDRPSGWHQPTAGDCFVLRNGTYSTHYLRSAARVGLLFEATGSSDSHVRVLNYPGHTPVFDFAGTSSEPVLPFLVRNSAYVDVAGLTVSGNYSGGQGIAGDDGNIGAINSSHVDFSRLIVADNGCLHDSNCVGVYSHSNTSVSFHHLISANNFDPDHAGQNNGNFLNYRGVGLSVTDSTFWYSPSNATKGQNVKLGKHVDSNTTQYFRRNRVQGGLRAIDTGGGVGVAIANSILADCDDAAIRFADLGGTSFHLGLDADRNTIVNCRALVWNPTLGYDMDGDAAADACSGDPTLGTTQLRRSIIVDNHAYASDAEQRLISIHVYGPKPLYDASIGAGKLVVNDNCVSTTNTPQFGLFESNNGDETCSGRASGSNYANWAAWRAAGYDADSHNEDPDLDDDLRATAANCEAWGWSAGLFEPAPSQGGGFLPFIQ